VADPEEGPMATPVSDARQVGIQVEAKIREWNLDYRYVEEVAVADLKVIEGSQIRELEHRVNPIQVAEYVEQMRQGVVFPPIVLWNDTMIIDGNTRIAAARTLRRKTFPAFQVAFPNGDFAKAFAATLNQMNGRRLSTEEAHEAALTLFKYDHTEDAIARELGYSKSQIANWRREAEYAKRAERMRLSTDARQLPKNIQRKLVQISHDAPLSAAAEVVAKYQPKAEGLNKLVEDIKKATSDAAALELVETAKREWAPVGPPPHRPSVSKEMAQAKRIVPQIRSFLGHEVLLVEPDDLKRAEWIAAWRDIERLAKQVIAVHG